eukprot:gnl/TRDRNA2_/TRDRNA2_88801_c0_seq1.p1 gnl/TRDRNA2_/TRDRNA2_88801_c0~~gnl/TRDRNA2_/TRDRNA2_88801_c0_seq1.p1  ORF type:complete len:372 (+),score=28.26 gnl/TRDRNA2_/TRDRNA2_88801_c0_seq1:186-1301(+)
MKLTIDHHKRVASSNGKLWSLNFSFRSFPCILRPNEEELFVLQHDCIAAFSTTETYWMPANGRPRSALEELALRIFWFHTRSAAAQGEWFDAARSGAEWWTLVIGRENNIGWHWDKDSSLEAHHGGLSIHPHLSTVTYLTDGGTPTLVTDKRCDLMCDNITGPLHRIHLSYPRVGKHICFDGQLLHGGAAGLGHLWPQTATKRVTFLANIWLNHRPLEVQPFHNPEVLSSCDKCRCVSNLFLGKDVDVPSWSPTELSEHRALTNFNWHPQTAESEIYDQRIAGHIIRMSLPVLALQAAVSNQSFDCVSIDLLPGTAAVEPGDGLFSMMRQGSCFGWIGPGICFLVLMNVGLKPLRLRQTQVCGMQEALIHV